MQTEKDSVAQVGLKVQSLSESEKYKKCLELYYLAKAISKKVDHPIKFIAIR